MHCCGVDFRVQINLSHFAIRTFKRTCNSQKLKDKIVTQKICMKKKT